MKNKIIKYFLIIFFLPLITKGFSNDDFVIESNTIEYKENNNVIIATGNVKITSNDNVKISADQSEYIKLTNELFLNGNVEIIDQDKEIRIQSEKVRYYKNKELIQSIGATNIDFGNNYTIDTTDLDYLRLKKILKSNKKTILYDNFNNEVETDSFVFYANEKKFKSKNLKLKDNNLNEYIAKESLIDLNKNKIAAKDIEIYFSKTGNLGENSRLKGNYMISDDNITIIEKGILTSCKPRNDCPPWTMQSETIKHNKKKKLIEYKNAWLKLYDKPVFYFPKFFHPDPTVKRQSGFLIPSIATSTNSGNSIKIPYFNALADNKDFTVTPRLYFNNDILLQNEFRQIEKNLNHITDFSLKKMDEGSKSHFFSNSKIDLNSKNFNQSKIEINIEKTSNDTYLKSEKLVNSIQDNQSLLNSYLKYEAFTDDFDLTAEIAAYEDLTKEKNSDKFQFILPSFKISKIFNPNINLNGNFKYSGSGVSQKKKNVTENLLINNFDFNSNRLISKNGFVSNFKLLFKNVSKEGRNSTDYSEDFENRTYLSSNYTIGLPLKKKKNNFESNLTPKLSLRYSPFDSQNISDKDRKININNIFTNNRLGLTDSLEGGQSLTLGFDYNLSNQDNKQIFSSSLGQIFRDKNDSNLPYTSKLQNKSSDIVGQIQYTPNDNFELNYNFSADNNLDATNYSLIEAKMKINNFVTTFDFLEENNEIGSDSYFARELGYNFNSNNFLKFNTRRNRKTDLTEYYNLIYEYKNDCLVAAVEYNKNYYEDRDIKPIEEVFFTLTIVPFSSVNSPNFSK